MYLWQLDCAEVLILGIDCIVVGTGFGKTLPFTIPSLLYPDKITIVLLLDKGGDKLWDTIRDGFVVKSKVEIDFVKKEDGCLFCDDGFLSGAENHPLSKAMVDHNQE